MNDLAFQEQKVRGTQDFPVEFHHVDKTHPRYHMPLHWHMDYELLRVVSGQLVLSLNAQRKTLVAGDIVLIRDGVVHGGTPTDCVYQCVDVELSGFLHSSALAERDLTALQSNRITPDAEFPQQSEEAAVVHRLFDVLQAGGTGHVFLARGLILQLIGLMLQNHRYAQTDETAQRGLRRIRQLKAALGLIRTRYNTALSLQELAAAAGMTPKYFCRFFAEMTGRTPIDYLNYYRVECACTQLLYTEETVTAIALGCGFNDLSYFVKTFKKYKGLPPKKFRKGNAV